MAQGGDDYFEIWDSSTQTWYYPISLSSTDQLEYPIDWFKKHHSKPTVRLPKITNNNLDNYRLMACAFLNGEKTGMYPVLQYLRSLFETMKVTLDENWESYGITIPAGEITPLDLLAITDMTTPSVTSTFSAAANSNWDRFLVTSLFVGYRYSLTHPKHQKIIFNKMISILEEMKVPGEMMIVPFISVHNCVSLKENDAFVALASVFDMFCVKFQDFEYCKARFGTVITRMSGCGTLNSVRYFAEILGYTKSYKIINWIFVKRAAEEIRKIFLFKKDELAKPHSYFPYASGLKLVSKNPYSAGSNPNFHFLIHVCGCLMHKPRSYNAVYLEAGTPISLVINACLIYIATKKGSRLQMEERKVAMSASVRRAREVKNDDPFPEFEFNNHTTPNEWLEYFKETLKYKFSKDHILEITDAVNAIPAMRKGTIGNWVKTSLLTFLVKED